MISNLEGKKRQRGVLALPKPEGLGGNIARVKDPAKLWRWGFEPDLCVDCTKGILLLRFLLLSAECLTVLKTLGQNGLFHFKFKKYKYF